MQFDPDKRPEYIFIHPFRFVRPYAHSYETHAKKRWLGKNILEVLTKQFQAYSHEYFKQAIIEGKITINGKKIGLDYTVRNSDLLRHETIREEPPILHLPIQILHEDPQFLVVCKPPSMIVHTGGGYHYNTMMAILHYEMGYKNLYILHRIDRLTSGVVILAKKKEKSVKFHQESMEEVMKKSYYARVGGDVGFQERLVEVPMVCLSHKQGIWSVFNPQTMQDHLKTQTPKQSITKFTKLWYDKTSNTSLLQCHPITGRTHQIRVHLQHLGHPILNDIVYGGIFVGNWVIERVREIWETVGNEGEVVDRVEKRVKGDEKQEEKEKEEEVDEEELKKAVEYEKWDYKTRPLEICLHSFRYKFQGKQYTSRKPYWVDPQTIKIPEGAFENSKDPQKEQKPRSKYELDFLSKVEQKKEEEYGEAVNGKKQEEEKEKEKDN